MIKLRPTSNRLAVRPDSQDEMFNDTIHIPATAKYIPQTGRVIAVGPGFMTDIPLLHSDGLVRFHRQNMHVEEGDRIFFAKNVGVELEIGRDKFIVMRESDVLAIIAEEEDANG